MNLYEIAKEIQMISEMVDEDGVLLPEAEVFLDKLQMDKETKFKNIGALIKNLSSDAEALKAEKQRLQKLEKQHENKVMRLKAFLKFAMEANKDTKFHAGIFNFSLRDFPSVMVEDPTKLPKKYQKIEIEANKTLIMADLKLGVKIKGASVIHNNALVIS